MLISPLIVQLGLWPPYQYGRVGWDSDLQYSLDLLVIYLLLLLLLVDLLLTHSCTHTSTVSQSLVQEAKSLWSWGLPPIDPPSGGDASVQRAWDDPVVECSFDSLVASAPDDLSRARLLAVSAPESGLGSRLFQYHYWGLDWMIV